MGTLFAATQTITLRPYQVEAAAAFHDALQHHPRQVIHLPTGTGKTTVALSIARQIQGRTLWLAHRDELIEQPLRALSMVWPEADAGVCKAGRDEIDAGDIVFASIQTAHRPRRLAALAQRKWGLIVADECHHARARTWQLVLDGVGGKDVPVLGLTATPERADGQGLDEIFGGICYTLPLPRAISEGWLVPFRQVRWGCDMGLSDVSTRQGDFSQGELAESLERHHVAEATRDAILANCAGLKTLVFCAGVRLSKLTRDALRAAGLAAAHLDGTMGTDDRRNLLRKFADGTITHLCNVQVLTEGYDQPDVGAVVMARPTKSKALYIQMAGRGLRPAPGKDELLLVDLVDNAAIHDLAQASTLLGRARREQAPEPGWDQDQTTDPLDAEEDRWLSQLRNARSRVRGSFAWVRAGRSHALSAGDQGTVLVQGDGTGLWTVDIVRRVNGKDVHSASLTTEPVSLEWAVGVAEDFVRRVGAGGLTTADAPWRAAPATPSQIRALERWRITAPDGITKGEASDLISQRIAAATVRRLRSRTRPSVTWWNARGPDGKEYSYATADGPETAKALAAKYPGYPVWTVREHADLLGLSEAAQYSKHLKRAKELADVDCVDNLGTQRGGPGGSNSGSGR